MVEETKVTHDNNGRFYRIKMDLAKEGSEIWDLTPYFKGRVGDNRFGLQVVWTYQGRLLDTTGMKPYIEGNVGNYSFDDKKDLQLAPDAATVRYTGSPSDCQSGGRATYYFPEQMFPRDGIFKGYIGLLDDRDDSSQPHISGVTVWFRVLPGIAQMGHACDVYISDLDKALQNFKVKLDQHDKDYQTQLQQVIDDARNTYNSQVKNSQDALVAMQAEIDEGRGDATHLAGRLSDMLTQIKDNDIVTIHQHQEDISKISTAINDRLKNMKTAPVGIADEQTLRNTYPNGADGLFVTLDTKHLYMWLNGQWSDAGPYETAQLDKQVEQSIGDVKSTVLKENLIKNGSFSDGTLDGVFGGLSSDKLHILNFLNRNWACLQSDTAEAYHGLNWLFDNPLNSLGQNYPFHIEFDLVTAQPMALNVNLVPFDHDNNRLGGMMIKTITTNSWELKHFDVDFGVDDKYINADHFVLQIIQTEGKPVQEMRVTGVICYLKYHKIADLHGGLIANGDFNTGLAYPAYSNLSGSTMSVIDFANQRWLDFQSPVQQTYQGIDWVVANPINTLGQDYPLKLKLKLVTSKPMNINIYWIAYTAKGEQIGGASGGQILKELHTQGWRFYNQEINFRISDQYRNADHFVLRILQPDNATVEHLQVTDLDLRVIYDESQDTKGNLIVDGNMSSGAVSSQVASNTGNGTLNVLKFENHNWLSFSSDKNDAYQGLTWQCPNPIHELGQNYPLHLKFTMMTAENMTLQADILAVDAQGKQIGSILLSRFNTRAWRSVTYNFMADLNAELSNADQLYLQIVQPDGKPIQEIRITDIIFEAVYDNYGDTKSIAELEQQYGLPIMMINGDLSGMDHDHAKNITYDYKNKNTHLSGYGTVKWQGSSSATLAKKGYRLKTTKSDYSEKDKIRLQPSWQKHHKFNLKAYYNDGMLSRDPVSANIGAKVSASRSELPRDLINEDNFGYIDGFPIILFLNGEYQGIYSFNLPRPDFSYTKWAIMANQYNDICQFIKVPDTGVKMDESDWLSLNPDGQATDDQKKAVTDLINWVIQSDDATFVKDLDKHFDIPSMIDYVVVTNILGARDAYGKNQVLLTWDGKIWYYQLYDLDCTYNANWMGGKVFETPKVGVNLPFGSNNNLFVRFTKFFKNAISDRYREIRQWLTPGYVLAQYKQRINLIGQGNFEQEWAKWNDPSKDTEDFKQLQNDLYDHFKAADYVWLGNDNPDNTTYKIKPDFIPEAPTTSSTASTTDSTKTDPSTNK